MPVFVGLGLISYSLYLWHWPVLVFTKIAIGPLTLSLAIACILASVILGALSWRLIEQPFRGRSP